MQRPHLSCDPQTHIRCFRYNWVYCVESATLAAVLSRLQLTTICAELRCINGQGNLRATITFIGYHSATDNGIEYAVRQTVRIMLLCDCFTAMSVKIVSISELVSTVSSIRSKILVETRSLHVEAVTIQFNRVWKIWFDFFLPKRHKR